MVGKGETNGVLEEKNFLLIRKLGEGGFGEVWLAKDRGRNQEVAVKFLRTDLASPQIIEFFKREFEILCELKHVHLAGVFEFGYAEKRRQYFFSSEYCPGKPLLDALQGKPISFFEEALVQILSALDCIHSQKIVHFDIKPENILVSEENGHPRVKLLDFGLAAKLKRLSGGRGGTLAFMAPESLDPEATMDHRVDLYALGMVCLQSLTGKFPFLVNDAEDIEEWHRQGDIPEKMWEGRDIPPYLREITEKLLAKKPSDRFSNARVILNFLNLASGGKYSDEEKQLKSGIPAEGPLVEREGILTELQGRLHRSCLSEKGETGTLIFFLQGESGIGKSRILEEIRHFAQLKEIRNLSVRCDWEIPTWPRLAQALDLPPFPDEHSHDWQVRRKALALMETARKTPLCLFLDDFQKAEGEMKQVLDALHGLPDLGEKDPVRLFVLAATEEKTGEGFALERLSPGGVSRYLRLVLGESDKLDGLAKLIHQYSGGLPLLMVEGIKYLAPHLFRGEPLENLLPPPGLRSLYRDRLAGLNPEEEELLLTAALLFRSVSAQEYQHILGHAPPQISRLAHGLLRVGLIRERTPSTLAGEFASPHALYEVESQALALDLIQGLDHAKRRSLHSKIAQGLEALGKKGEKILLQEIAYHLAKGGRNEEAIRHYKEAAENFKAQSLVSSAADCLAKALQVSEAGSLSWQELLEELSRLQILTGAFGPAETSIKKLENFPSPRLEELKGWLAFKQRKLEQARESYLRALQGLPPENLLKRILLENALANIDLQEGKYQEAASRFQRTLQWEKENPSRRESVRQEGAQFHNNNLGLALVLLGDVPGALQFYQERLNDSHHDSESLSYLNGIGFVYLKASRYPEAISSLKQAMDLAEKTGALHTLFTIMGNLTTALLKEGRYAESVQIMKKIAAHQEKLGNRHDLTFNLLRQCSTYLNLGMKEPALDCILKGQKLSEDTSEEILKGWFLLMEGYWEKEFGSQDRAEKYFQETEEAAVRLQDLPLLNWALFARADLSWERENITGCELLMNRIQGDIQDEEFQARRKLLEAKISPPQEAEPQFAFLENHCRQNHFQEILWEVYQAWARADWGQGRIDSARSRIEEGIKVVESIAKSLPEEFRDRYLHQKSRKKLFEDREEMRHSPKKSIFERIKGLMMPHRHP